MFDTGDGVTVSGLLTAPETARFCLVLAHGAGAGMNHPFMQAMADELGARGAASFRFQFPYMEKGTRRPDQPAIAEAAMRAAVNAAARLAPGLPLFAGGKSFGGRMTSLAQANAPLPGVRGLVFLGFPLHAAGKPSVARGEHLSEVKVPMLFVQGMRDKLAEPEILKPVCAKLKGATLHLIDDADHSFHVPKRSGRSDDDVRSELAKTTVGWAKGVLAKSGKS